MQRASSGAAWWTRSLAKRNGDHARQGLCSNGDAARMQAAAAKLRAAGFATHEHSAEGSPEEALSVVRERDIGLPVLGKSAHSRLRQLFIGSTTLELMRSCQVPVLIFP